MGAVGNPSFDHYPNHLRPEAGLLRLRRELGAYANLRPAICFPGLEDCSPLRADLVRGTDLMIVRELLGGLYFGEPRSVAGTPGSRVATNTMTSVSYTHLDSNHKESKLKLSLETRYRGDVLIVHCQGRIVYRDEAVALSKDVYKRQHFRRP